ncbi:MAG: type II toxin-antitoxin system Phd/YefM family antitoxin [Anaerolineae bacterium]|jgi:prevent-host-death family protein|nr:type II toxin-antitoxin system Phd/YefM family antitoxin [Anaerolineae bacterium]
MTMIGVRELRQQTSELLRKLKEEKAEYIITYQGQPVALLLPLDTEAVQQAIIQIGKQGAAQGWNVYAHVAERVRASWSADADTQTVLDDIRG